jgi:hypothetical protein
MPSAGWVAIAEAIEVTQTAVFRIAASHQRQRRRNEHSGSDDDAKQCGDTKVYAKLRKSVSQFPAV